MIPALESCRINLVDIKDIFYVNGVLQFRLRADCGEPLDKTAFVSLHASDHNIGISYINR